MVRPDNLCIAMEQVVAPRAAVYTADRLPVLQVDARQLRDMEARAVLAEREAARLATQAEALQVSMVLTALFTCS